MFCNMPAAYYPDFQVESCFASLEQVECYKARAKALIHRFPWSDNLRSVWTASLVHMSTNVPGKVAYYANVKALMENRLTRTSPEMFLARQLINAPEYIQAAWSHEVMGNLLPTLSFIEKDNADGWYEVYDNGPQSCMAGSHRVRQYAHPKSNLALAYIDTGTEITHRAIVNRQRKTYLRVYGRDAGYFVAALHEAGFRQDNETLCGEPIWLDYASCRYCDREVEVGPYFDGNTDNYVTPINDKEATIGGSMPLSYSESPECIRCECGADDEDYDENNDD